MSEFTHTRFDRFVINQANAMVVRILWFCVLPAVSIARTRSNFDFSWKFHLGELPGDSIPSRAVKAGYDDSHWRQLNVPHDFIIEGEFDKSENPVLHARTSHTRQAHARTHIHAYTHGKTHTCIHTQLH